MSLDLSKLKNLRMIGGKTIAQCPACAEDGKDSKCEHLYINGDGHYGCVMFQASEGHEHRQRIEALVGMVDLKPSREKSIWTTLPSAPESAPFPALKHYKYGQSSARWIYRTDDGRIAGIVARFETPEGKVTLPMSWCRDQFGRTEWRWKAMPVPRTIYALPLPAETIVIVEGEKCAEAVIAAGLPATTWAGGASAVSKSDWSPLTGKICVIWPDNDGAGERAKDVIVRELSGIAAEIRIVQIPQGRAEKWDAADTDCAEILQLVNEAVLSGEDEQQSDVPKWYPMTDDLMKWVWCKWEDLTQLSSDSDPHVKSEMPPERKHETPPLPQAKSERKSQKGEFYYDGKGFYRDNGTVFVPMNRESVHSYLEEKGYREKEQRNPVLNRIQDEHFVSYAGPIAGMQRGFYPSSTGNILVTQSPVVIQPSPGRWPILRRVIEGLLGDDPDAGNTQVNVFLAWIKVAREALKKGKRRPGQALALTGPRGSGKTLLIDILEQVLGGRRADPYAHFTGRTNFNGDLVGAELLVIDDESGSTDIRARRNLAASIKHNLFSGKVRIEAKYRTPATCSPFWRLVIACNNEPEALLVLPPLTEDIGDKITLFKCHKRPLPMPAFTQDDKEAFMAKIVSEIPAMLHFLETWEIPENLREDRCGVTFYHHPEILSNLAELAPETSLLNLIDTAAAAGGIALPWSGGSTLLRVLLSQCEATRRESEKLLGGANSTGVYLGRLESSGNRVRKGKLRDGLQQWEISSVSFSSDIQVE
jgi:hypothetical protein